MEASLAFGIELRLSTRKDGGRSVPLLGGMAPETQFRYRPNWGLPGMRPPDQTGAPVLGFSRENIAPGDTVHAVIVAVFFDLVPSWSAVEEGCVLPMYEGPRAVGTGRVLWRMETSWPLPDDDRGRFLTWLADH
jgi:hypothetical protein